MSVMEVVQMTVYKVVYMIPMRHCFMPAARSVHMPRFVPGTLVSARAIARILRAHLERVLVIMPIVRMMQMPVMQIIHMPFMLDRRMAASRAVDVFVIFVYVMAHFVPPFPFVSLTGPVSVEWASALKINPATC